MSHTGVRFSGVTKRFAGITALDDVSFDVARGTCHAVCGENGAGKSTLSNILTGLYRPDEGEISLYGELVRFQSPSDAIDAGIGPEVLGQVGNRSNVQVIAQRDDRSFSRTFGLIRQGQNDFINEFRPSEPAQVLDPS